MPEPTPRPATAADVPRLREIEVSAGEAFREIGMDAIARDAPPPAQDYRDAAASGQLWVIDSEDASGSRVPVAYLWAVAMDRALHIEQVSVAATHARRGLGRLLIEHLAAWPRVCMRRDLATADVSSCARTPAADPRAPGRARRR